MIASMCKGLGWQAKAKRKNITKLNEADQDAVFVIFSNSISKSPTIRKACSKQLNNKNGAKNRNA